MRAVMAVARFAPVLAGLALALCASAAHACPVCHSATGLAVRAALFNGHFFRTLAIVALPCPLLLLAVALVHFAMPDLRGSEPDRVRNLAAEPSRVSSGAAA